MKKWGIWVREVKSPRQISRAEELVKLGQKGLFQHMVGANAQPVSRARECPACLNVGARASLRHLGNYLEQNCAYVIRSQSYILPYTFQRVRWRRSAGTLTRGNRTRTSGLPRVVQRHSTPRCFKRSVEPLTRRPHKQES